MELSIIVAISENNVIGNEGEIPWHIPEDLKRFKKLTMGHPVIMGRKTFDLIPSKFKPLSGRTNIVVTRNLEFEYEGVIICRSIHETLRKAGAREIGGLSYVAGGGEIYRQFLPLADRMEITKVKGYYKGDSYFPTVNWSQWEETFKEEHENYSFHTYRRKR